MKNELTIVSRVLILAAGFAGSALAESDVMPIVDKNGVKLSARLVSCDGTNVTVNRESDKKTFTIPLARLDDTSQASVSTWIAGGGNLREKFEITVDTGKNRRTAAGDDFDDKRVNLDPVVTVRNPDPRQPSRGGKVTVLFLGRPVSDNSSILVFKKTTFDLPELKPLTSQEFPVGNISSAYDSRGYAKFGARYLGYVVLVHDAEGRKLYDSNSVPDALAANHRLRFLKLTERATYDRDLKPLAAP